MSRWSLVAGAVVLVLALAAVATSARSTAPHRHHRTEHDSKKPTDQFWLNGLLAAAMTAFAPDGSLNLTAIPLQAAWLQQTGVKYVFLGGTTSECLSLTVAERQTLVEAWAPLLSRHALQMVVHVGAEAIADARALAQHAVAHGAVAVASIPPVYFKPASQAALLATIGAIAAAVPATPFLYYHFPAMTGSLASGGLVPFVEAAAQTIPNFHGVKYTDDNLLEVGTLVRWRNPTTGRPVQVLMGKDELLDDALLTGVTAFIGSTYGYAAPLYARIIDAFAAGNLTAVELEQARAQDFINVFSAYNAGDNIRGNKPVMQLKTGIAMGGPRLPQEPLPAEQVATLQQQLDAIGFFQWSS